MSDTIIKRYRPHSHNVDVPVIVPWLEVHETVDDREVLHDTDYCHCVKCCVTYRVAFQQLNGRAIEATKLILETKTLVHNLVDAGTKTDRKSPQTAREDMINGPSAWLSPVERQLRKMLAFAYSKLGALYGDDGELHDSTMPFPIDFMRDSLDRIEEQMNNRGMAKLAELMRQEKL